MAIRRSRNRRRLLVGLVCVCVIGTIVFSVFSVVSLKNEQKTIREQQEALEKEKAQLEKELSEINDSENIEEQAREQLKLIKKGEWLYVFPEEVTDATKENEDSAADGASEGE